MNAAGSDPLSSSLAQLRPLLTPDTDWAYMLMTHSQGSRWRYRGRTPSPAVFASDLWHGVHAQYVACDANQERCGIVGLYNANHVASHCHLFAVAEPGRTAIVAEASALLIDYAFAEFDFAKIWIEAPAFNLEQFSSLSRVADLEGRLTDHDFWRGRFWDLFILSIGRAKWDEGKRRRDENLDRVRSEASNGTGGWGAIDTMLLELWPLDSLGRVELLAALEEVVGEPVPDEVLLHLGATDPAEVAIELRAILDRSSVEPDSPSPASI